MRLVKPTKQTNPTERTTLFQKISLLFFDRPRFAAVLFLIIFAFGVASYTTFLKREGFPSVSVPFSLVNGPYLVNDPVKVDTDVTKPLSQVIVKQPNVKSVKSTAGANFFNVVVEYKSGTDPTVGSKQIEQAVDQADVLPAQAKATFKPLKNAVNERGDDVLVSFYAPANNRSTRAITDNAQKAAAYLKQSGDITLAQDISVVNPFVSGINPATGKVAIQQTTFDRYGVNTQSSSFYTSVVIGIKGKPGFDVLKLDKQVLSALDKLNTDPQFNGFRAERSYSIAPQINDQISNLQQSLLEGLIAVLVISALLIAFRASIITVASMVLVIAATLAFIKLIGYTLNVITLFSLVLCLSLIVDDTIIMVEAIDAQRRRSKSARDVVAKATKKISRAMLAATLTATIGFAPLLFVGGILGSFIRAIPITVIASLLISLIMALTFIPFLSRFVLLRPKLLGKAEDSESPAHHGEVVIAKTLSRPLLWMKHHRGRQWGLGLAAVIIGFGFIAFGGYMFSQVTFNIFAPTKDSDQISVKLNFPANTTIQQAEATADRADQVVGNTLGVNFKQGSYYGQGSVQNATLYIDLLSFKKRAPKSPELIKQLEQSFVGFQGASVQVSQQDAGPPASAFTVRINSDNPKEAYRLAKDVAAYMQRTQLKRPNGTTASFRTVTVANPDTITRDGGTKFLAVSGEFTAADTSTLVLLAQTSIKDHYTAERLKSYGLKTSDLSFDIGQESDNQNSFKTLLIAFPLLLIVIYILLVFQFRSLLQPALIFLAIPFSFPGITTGLWATDNAFSFFTMLGFFALIGLSIKNTILLTDYANQARRAGNPPIDAIAIALQERFRPLIATSLTAIVSLVPLILANPFWEGLGVTLICGLLASTFLVITVFPYFYLGSEYLRLKISRRAFVIWLVVTVVTVGILVALGAGPLSGLAVLLTIIIVPIILKLMRRDARA